VLFTSDLHLSPEDPEGVERFVRFARGPAAEASRLLLVGDVFDVWVTPAQLGDRGLAPAFRALSELVAAGVAVGFVEGNRDFAATPDLAALGVQPLPDVVVLGSRGLRVATTHGDQLCTRDVGHQALRRVARSGVVRHLLRTAPPGLARRVGAGARATSRRETARKPYDVMGLVPAAVAGLLRTTGADALVCGHVHWGRRFRMEVGGRARDVVVTGAWDEGHGSFAALEAGVLSFHRVG
jgi:UDP-2,3-diacylglucosamine hydrolase